MAQGRAKGGEIIDAILIACATFVALTSAALGSLAFHRRLPSWSLQDDTNTTVRLVANIFVVMASLLLGLMANSAKTTYETANTNLHAYATDLILLDRTIRALGSDGADTRAYLAAYMRQSLSDAPISIEDRQAEQILEQGAASLRAIPTADARQTAIWNDARQQFRDTVRQRWVIIDRAEGKVPYAIVAMLIAWLTLIFASFGYRAPRNPVVIASFVFSAALLSASLYLILDMNEPFSGAIQVSARPMERALEEMTRHPTLVAPPAAP